MKRAAVVMVALIGTGACASDGRGASSLGAAVAAWPDTFTVTGTKSEPSYVEHVSYGRVGDRFGLTIDLQPQGRQAGGTSRSVLSVDARGDLSVIACTGDCGGSVVQGFLATASVVAAARRGELPTGAHATTYAGRKVLCVDNAALGTTDAVLDPCLDVETGALIAQRSRHDGTFAGPTLDERSIRVSTKPDPGLVTP
jgi:hypothetical protein